jgi:uncharacterized Zn-binding protein involved in type VI secretion
MSKRSSEVSFFDGNVVPRKETTVICGGKCHDVVLDHSPYARRGRRFACFGGEEKRIPSGSTYFIS